MDMLLASGEQVSIALLAMALNAGVSATSMTGPQVGIATESTHGQARISGSHRPIRTASQLARWWWLPVPGHQHQQRWPQRNHTLGRGAPTPRCRPGGGPGCRCLRIYTDVPGVLSTDPRKVSDQLMETISCDEMLELASLGPPCCIPGPLRSPVTTA